MCLMHMPVVHTTLKTLLQDLSLQAAPPQLLSQAEISNATEIKVGGGSTFISVAFDTSGVLKVPGSSSGVHNNCVPLVLAS